MGVHAEERAQAVGVGLVDLDAAFAADLVVDAGLLHLETGGVDQHVDGIGLALEHRPSAVISVMPLPCVSTRWTFGRL